MSPGRRLHGDLLERVDRWAELAPERLAHVSGDRSLTYGDLIARSSALADHLVSVQPGDDSPIIIQGHKEPELLIAFLGAAKSGRPYIPVEDNLPAQRLERIREAAGASLTLTPARVAEWAPANRTLKPRHVRDAGAVTPERPYYIMFTSGSTGEPKGVVITHGCLEAFLNWMQQEQGFTDGEVFLNQAPYSFDLSIMDTYVALVSGGTIFSVTRDDVALPKRRLEAFARSGISVWVSTPSFAQLCLAQRTFGASLLPRLHTFLFCGEILPHGTAAQLRERFPQAAFWNTYGPTEATVATTSIRIDAAVLARHSPLPIGHAMPGTRVLVVDADGREVAPGERGEIVIAGPNVSPGYLGRPDLNARAFFALDGQRAYHTGDWGRLRDGLLFCEGRMDNQIKLHGHRLELGDVESNLRTLAGVADAVVLPVLWQGQPDALSAFVVMTERGAEPDFELGNRLRDELARRVPAYMLPRQFIFVEDIPLNANGKADRKKLADILAGAQTLPAGGVR